VNRPPSSSAPDDPGFPNVPCLTLPLPVAGVHSAVTARPADASDRSRAPSLVSGCSGLHPEAVHQLRQVHGATVRTVDASPLVAHTAGDALITLDSGVAICVRVADCAPVVLTTADGRGIGIVHAGWRGARADAPGAAVAALCTLTGCGPGELWAAIGPALGPCCFEVGPEVAADFPARLVRSEAGRLLLDLPGAIALHLETAGLRTDRIDRSRAVCTLCNRDAPGGLSFHSYRGSAGGPARNLAFIVKGPAR